MGIVQKTFCDVCGAELEAKRYQLKITDIGALADTTDIDICGSCYSVLSAYFRARRSSVSTEWQPVPPETNPPTDLGV